MEDLSRAPRFGARILSGSGNMASDRSNTENSASKSVKAILAGDRRALARAITLIESAREDHQAEAQILLEALLPHTGKAVRIGISGSPGVGKSTFIEAFGLYLTSIGKRLAVLAVDPSSSLSGGSILGDKTRMERLARQPSVFIRPSPAGGALGGVARRTRETLLACEAAGVDVVLIETVGVGQSEAAVAGLVDIFALLVQPGGGDDLQGIKRGVMELADLVIVTKADGSLRDLSHHTESDYRAALALMRPRAPGLKANILSCSALEERGLEEIWRAVQSYNEALNESGELAARRAEQATSWMWREVEEYMMAALHGDSNLAALSKRLESEVAAGRKTPAAAAAGILAAFRHENGAN
jgi:LAO/AO transport system kinase